ncbi:23S rRNA (guanosine(2251)-2'-O)-methyltransferase RlmB [Clostridium folliculivorans]|uniref:23S rRNA (Guanosine(2251)-2'-O)-methyltransferase RlmB n=1 Tax=Clostridium folliculivorans TaxID=2886038 RepID=A0A9W6DDH0_9CLOT|nr:23S rRNA (guanosine(2251)-2'-O)-methyltransferase RlmB [Clostridium folliculivorans]GKU27767.1 23S rRNA (guanosine(2251)-2'-O)-methyltransferase RlmB [Clostridium folliculivorans]GKU32567.1 23S rRNA (guanosine(2251)-2'-O)-methyltransferase RlmB [Clostridium folliculivorans]
MAQRMNKSNNKNENKTDYKKNNKFVKNEVVKKNTREDRREVDALIREDVVVGRNAVIEALKSDTTIEQILIANGNMEGSINKVIAMAKDKKVVIKEVDRKKLDSISETGAHQGVIAIVTPFKYSEVEDILKYAEEKGEKPFIVILDELEDPHNLGSIVRTAELSGVHGIIIPKRRNVGITPTVYKSAAGAIEHMKIAKVTNINAVIDELKEAGVWVYGAEIDGDSYSYETDFSGACALIIGSEGRGMSKLTKDKCDKLVKIPMVGKINSLNASVAGGIMMYEILKSRLLK